MLALAQTAMEQVRTQRDQVKQALKRTVAEVADCQEGLASLEFSRPSGSEMSGAVGRLAQVQEKARWQQHEVEVLTVVEQQISKEAAEFISLEGMHSSVPLEANVSL